LTFTILLCETKTLFFLGDVLFKRIGEEGMESDHLVLFGVMQGNGRDGLEGWLKNFIPLLWKRLEGDGYKITILSSSYLFFTSLILVIF